MGAASRRRRGNALPVLVFSLAVLALLRAADLWIGFSGAAAEEADIAFAVSAAPGEEGDPASPSRSPARAAARNGASPRDAEPPGAARSDVETRLFNQLAARRQDLDKRERNIETREKLLRVAEARIETRIAALEAEAQKLRTLQTRRRAADEADYEALSSAYEKMKPRDAARIFEALDDEILVPVAAGMRTQAISGVLAEMDPDKARSLTRKLANRNRARRAGEGGAASP